MYSYIKGTVEEINLDYIVIDNNNIVDLDANIFLSALNGLINITIPSIKPVLHIIEPTAFPKLIVA